jgi:lipopolysaccharide export system permease protein
MGKTLRRYVLGEVLSVLALGLLATTFVLATVEMIDLVDLAFAKGVPALRVLSVFAYMVPSYLELTLPMALLLSIVAAFARLARDGEVLAMRAAGLSLGQLTRPLFALGLVGTAASFVLAAWISPWANRALESAVTDMAKTRITAALTPGVFSPWVEDIVVYVGELERRTGRMTQVMLADERDPDRPRTIFANTGEIATDDAAKLARFRMSEGTILADYANPLSFDRTDFQQFELNVSLGTETVEAGSSFMEEPRRMDWPALLAAQAAPPGAEEAEPEAARERAIEIQRRVAVPFACVLLPLIAVPLGVQQSRAVRSRGVVVGLAAILFYYFFVTAGVTLVHQNVLSAPVALWAPNLALALAGTLAFRRAAAEGMWRARRAAARTAGAAA